jgi:hypothetical protein
LSRISSRIADDGRRRRSSVVVVALVSADATGEWGESVLAGEPLAA